MAIGRVVRAIAGFYYVEPLEGGQPIECSIRGKLKLTYDIFVGDKVEYICTDKKGIITEILPRESVLKRPYIANVNCIVLIFAHHSPDPSDILIAKFLILAAASEIPYLIVFNKSDLVSKSQMKHLADTYRSFGYQVICTSVLTHLGKRTLGKVLQGKITVFAGPSGVGKTALVNMVAPGFMLKTGTLSEKISRGKHTTREVQLLPMNENSYIADTPGFSQIDLKAISPEKLADYFPDFEDYRGQCKFSTCIHYNEPGCRVKDAVEAGKISKSRYQVYIELFREIKEFWNNRYR